MADAGPAINSGFATVERRVTLGAIVLCALYSAGVMMWASPVSFYTLDDPYIHMALAENIARGVFGVNLDEVSNPSSSILWPWILAAFEKIGLMLWAPLLINIACFAMSVRVILRFSLKRLAPEGVGLTNALIVLGLGFLSFNLFGVIFTGMEHSLHVLLSIVVVTRVIDGRYDAMTLAALALEPLVRFEGALLLAFGFGAALHDRKWVFAAIAAAVPVACIGLYAMWLGSLGLPVLPSSVLSKSTLASGVVDGGGQVGALFANLGFNARAPSALIFAVLAGAMMFGAARRSGRDRLLALGVLAVLILAFLAGKLDGYGRYEVYALCLGGLSAVHLFSAELRRVLAAPMRVTMLGLGVIAVCVGLGPYVLATTPAAARNIDRQQHQMHRLAAECWKKPIAINDLGWVSFRNDAYVLDLWGLGSEEARKARAAGGPGWMQKLIDDKSVELAMIYRDWFPDVPETWTRVGTLSFTGMHVTPAYRDVSIFATRPEAIATARACLAQVRLPEGATIVASN